MTGLATCGKFRDSQIEYIWVIACPGMEHGVQLFEELLPLHLIGTYGDL